MTVSDNTGPNDAVPGAEGPLTPPPFAPPPVDPPPISGAQYFAAQSPAPPPSYAPYGPTPSPGWNQPPPYPGPGQQYGAAAYPFGPYNPYGYAPQQLGTSGLAIASLVTGICGFFCITPLISIGLGIAALANIRKTGRPGKGFAIAGLILSGVWIALIALLVATHHANFTTNTPQPTTTQGPNGTSA